MRLSLSSKSWKRSAPAARRGAPRCVRPRSGFQSSLEALERRRLLSTLTVSSAADSGSGSLRAEIAAAQSGDTIAFAAGLNGKTITLTSGELDLTKNLTIQGPGAGQLTISGNYTPSTTSTTHSSRVFEVALNTTVTLSGMTITYGDSIASGSSSASGDGSGGAILNHGTLSISGCTVSNSFGWGDGGGIYSDGTLSVSGSTISGNEGFYGGGICNSGTAALTSTTLSNNVAATTTGSYPFSNEGGGIYNQGTMVLNACTVSSNLSELSGGGISNYGTLTIENSSNITGNTAPGGYIPYDVDNLSVLYLDSTSTIGTLAGNPATSLSTLIVTSAADSGSGSLRAEITAAQSGQTIIFAGSLAGATITLTSGELDLTKNLTIQGPGAGQLTISGNSTEGSTAHASRVFEVAQNATVTLSGITISHGDGLASSSSSASWDGFGGGILNLGTLTVSACSVTGNQSYYYQTSAGGGIYNLGTMVLSGCTISGNGAFYGGGIYNNGMVTANNCTVSGNASGVNGGGIYNAFTMTISNGIVSGNGAGSGGDGGGIYNVGTLTVSGSTLTGNTTEQDEYGDIGGFGGGIYTVNGTVTISESTISGDISGAPGGGIFIGPQGTVSVQNNSSITGNGRLTGYSYYPVGDDVANEGVLDEDATSTVGTPSGNPQGVTFSAGGECEFEINGFTGVASLDITSGTVNLGEDLSIWYPDYALTVENGATVVLQSDQQVGQLQLNGNATLDIAASTLAIDYGSNSSPLGTIASSIQSGFNKGAGNGSGIISSGADAGVANATGVGYFDNGSQITVARTWDGDANLDGVVNADDLSLMMLGQSQHGTRWQDGNFNYDSQVNADDWIKLMYAAAVSQGQELANSNLGKSAANQTIDPTSYSANRLLSTIANPIFAQNPISPEEDPGDLLLSSQIMLT